MKVRFLIKSDGHLYVAMCLDFGLAAQANSIEAAKDKLIQQINEYIEEANEEDIKHKDKLLSRKGPFSWFILFYVVYSMSKIHVKLKEILAFTLSFTEVTPNFTHHYKH